MAATEPARHKLIILDACRDNPLDNICPGLKRKKLSFTRIEAGTMRGLLLVTSTQFGQSALDGLPGQHSPFAAALLQSLQAYPRLYFDQVMNAVARVTYDAAMKQAAFLQLPSRVVGGEAPADCLAGTGCVGDPRMVALGKENQRLAAPQGVRTCSGRREVCSMNCLAAGRTSAGCERVCRGRFIDCLKTGQFAKSNGVRPITGLAKK